MDNLLNEWDIITQNIALLVNSSPKTKTQIAKESGIVKSTISHYLSGKAFPSLVTLKHLCKALECEYEEILGKLQ